MASLFGAEFDIKLPENKIQVQNTSKTIKDLVNKINLAVADESELRTIDDDDITKFLKSNKVSIREKLIMINQRVLSVLGKQRNKVTVIKNKQDFEQYILDAIKLNKGLAIDTETNNSLDPVTCKLMGLCLYYPGAKQAYIPVNHVDPDTGLRLDWQMTEADIKELLEKVNQSDLEKIFHNGKFDYEVLKCTCGVEVVPDWDTMVGSRLLNENEPAALKWQYVHKVDKSQEKYDIESLFPDFPYQYLDPEIFALYAATDAFMTFALYLLQVAEFAKEEYGPHKDISGKHEVKGLRWLFHNVEMPIVRVTAEMELLGVKIDADYGARLKGKYDKLLEELDAKLTNLLEENDIPDPANRPVSTWYSQRGNSDSDACQRLKIWAPAKTKMAFSKLKTAYPYVDEASGKRYKLSKDSKYTLLSIDPEDPAHKKLKINLGSPVQLAILLYDIYKAPVVNEKNPSATGEDELTDIIEKLKLVNTKDETGNRIEPDATRVETCIKVCTLILERRGIVKLISTYIDVIPELAKHWPDGRIRFHLNSLGTDTGRYSSGGKIKYMTEDNEPVEVSGINIQNIPSRGPGGFLRMLFTADTKYHTVETDTDYYEIPETDEVETKDGWKYCNDLVIGDIIIGQEIKEKISKIEKIDKVYHIYTEGGDAA